MSAEKSIASVLFETKEELKQFVSTRLTILQAEMGEKLGKWKSAAPGLAIAATLLLTAWFALSFALVALIHALLLPSPFAWLWGGLIVGCLYAALGVTIGSSVYRSLTSAGLKPTRTIEVLKQDQIWIQNEARRL